MATALKLKSDIKKLKAAIDRKGTPSNLLPKLKAQLEKVENELASMKKGNAPRKVSTTKGTTTTLSKLQKMVQAKKYSAYQGAGVDLQKDAGESAFATGRRVSKGLKSNQHGKAKDNKGNVYYEYRANRIDVKQPKPKQTYPKLEDGGMMDEGGGMVYNYVKIKNYPTFQTEEEAKKFIKIGKPFLRKELKEGKIVLVYNGEEYFLADVKEKMASGDYMAKGGSVTEIDMAEVESSAKYYTDESRWSRKPTIEKFKEDISEYQELKRKLDNKEITPSKIIGTGIKPNLARPLAYRWLNERTMVAKRAIEILEERGSKMASGGMMAKGGMTSTKAKEIFEEYKENEDNNAHSENVVLLAKHFGTESDLRDAKTILAKHEAMGHMPSYLMQERDALSKKLYPKLIEAKNKMADGGMMAMGGALEHGLMVGDLVKGIKGNGIAIYNEKTKESFMVDVSKGSREKLSSMQFDKFSHGGNVMSKTHRYDK